jgi:hypothetical protein
MSFDARSRERLEALGRRLPRKLSAPAADSPTTSPSAAAPEPAPQRRHRVETEQDPERLFRELMNVSPDGTVPPHLLERLRDLEADRRRIPAPPATDPRVAPSPRPRSPRQSGRSGSDQDLYTVFQQLLLEEDPAD